MIDANKEQSGRILVMTAVAAEKEAVLRGLNQHASFDVMEAGVGPVSAAISTTLALANSTYDLVISAGIGGGFIGQAGVGSLVIADEIIAADLGAEAPDGFISLEELGFGVSRIPVELRRAKQLYEALSSTQLEIHMGSVITLATVTGTAQTATELLTRIPKVKAEAMEGFGVAAAAHRFGIPVLEIRAISNPVGPRDREAWKIREALATLEEASAKLTEVIS